MVDGVIQALVHSIFCNCLTEQIDCALLLHFSVQHAIKFILLNVDCVGFIFFYSNQLKDDGFMLSMAAFIVCLECGLAQTYMHRDPFFS